MLNLPLLKKYLKKQLKGNLSTMQKLTFQEIANLLESSDLIIRTDNFGGMTINKIIHSVHGYLTVVQGIEGGGVAFPA